MKRSARKRGVKKVAASAETGAVARPVGAAAQPVDAVVEGMARAVERGAAELGSKQERFGGDKPDRLAGLFLRWATEAESIPAYDADSAARDRWLAENWHSFPLWNGMIRNEAALNANRRWTLTGGRNAVNRARRVIQQWWVAPDVWGHRQGRMVATTAYHTQDLGAVIETARLDVGVPGATGPLAGFLHVDSSQCKLTGDLAEPLTYRGRAWGLADFWRLGSIPNTREAFNGLGLCSTSLILEILRVLKAVYEYDQEKLGARAPQGLLLLKNISQDQWNTAMRARSAELDGLERRYFGGVAVIASEYDDLAPEAKLLALSELPADFDRVAFVDHAVYAMALVLGRDPAEYWPVSGGSFGRSRETDIQHRKATAKAGNEFIRLLEDRFNDEALGLARGVVFEFEERDEEGKLLQAQVNAAWAEFARKLYAPGGAAGEPLLGREQVLSLLVEAGVVPPELTELEEDAQATELEPARAAAHTARLRDRALAQPRLAELVASLQARGATELIVRHEWPERGPALPLLAVDRGDLVDPATGRRIGGAVWVPGRGPARRARPRRAVLWDSAELADDELEPFTITDADVDAAIQEARDRGQTLLADLIDS